MTGIEIAAIVVGGLVGLGIVAAILDRKPGSLMVDTRVLENHWTRGHIDTVFRWTGSQVPHNSNLFVVDKERDFTVEAEDGDGVTRVVCCLSGGRLIPNVERFSKADRKAFTPPPPPPTQETINNMVRELVQVHQETV